MIYRWFLDYLSHSVIAASHENIKNKIYLVKDSVLFYYILNDDLGSTKINKEGIFLYLKLADFNLLDFKLESLFTIAPTQVVNLLLVSYISTNKPKIVLKS